MTVEPVLHVVYNVIAYDESGYGDNRSKTFTSGAEACEYARGLDPRFGASVYKSITMEPISIKIDLDFEMDSYSGPHMMS